MRYRVDLEHGGYISYDVGDYNKALEVYREEGIRIRQCEDIHDEGIVIEGEPIYVDLTKPVITN